MPENIPLQQRAGRNIGIEVLPPYIHGAGAPEIAVNPTGRTVIMEGQEGVVRSPSLRLHEAAFGFIFNQTAVEYDITILFVDDQNNETEIGDAALLANSVVPLLLESPFADGAFLGLCPGEKIVLDSAVAQPR